MKRDRIVASLVRWGDEMGNAPFIHDTALRAHDRNPWFIPENVKIAVTSLTAQLLKEHTLQQWSSQYSGPVEFPRTVGIIMAGNIPAVGFHDLLCVLASGHNAMVKLSSKDDFILPQMIACLARIDVNLAQRVVFTDQLKAYDAVIATGSSTSVQTFRQYFDHVPHLIRGHRNGVAILDGSESNEDLRGLGNDILMYFGLGCRNVSKIFVPKNYDLRRVLDLWQEDFTHLQQHNKYMNNYDYNKTLLLLNKRQHISSNNLHAVFDDGIHSRISTIHVSEYEDSGQVKAELDQKKEQIQCVVGKINGLKTLDFGSTQSPGLFDYADHKDTMKFLLQV